MFVVGSAVRRDELTELKQQQKVAVMRGNEWEGLKKSLSPILTFKECVWGVGGGAAGEYEVPKKKKKKRT